MKQEERTMVGGEKIFTFKQIYSSSKNNIFSEYENLFKDYFINYTFGGYYSLLAIFEDIKKNSSGKILIPSYTCESLVRALKVKGMSFEFYKVNECLENDFHDIQNICSRETVSAIIVIDYMGKSQNEAIQPHLSFYRNNGIKIIQDSVHSLMLDNIVIYGDYVFNSFRKITPFEGSLMLSRKKMNINYNKGKNYKFLYYKRLGQIFRLLHINYKFFRPEVFLKQFMLAEKYYYTENIYGLDVSQRNLIRKIDFEELMINSKEFYQKLLKEFGDFTVPNLRSGISAPFGFFLVLKNRNEKRNALRNLGIFCPIHWNLPVEVEKTRFPESFSLSQKALTIPLADLNKKNFSHLEESLKKVL